MCDCLSQIRQLFCTKRAHLTASAGLTLPAVPAGGPDRTQGQQKLPERRFRLCHPRTFARCNPIAVIPFLMKHAQT